jgi:hypothetical protein
MQDTLSRLSLLFPSLMTCPKYLTSFSINGSLFLGTLNHCYPRKFWSSTVTSVALSFLVLDIDVSSTYWSNLTWGGTSTFSYICSRTCPNKFGDLVNSCGSTAHLYCNLLPISGFFHSNANRSLLLFSQGACPNVVL